MLLQNSRLRYPQIDSLWKRHSCKMTQLVTLSHVVLMLCVADSLLLRAQHRDPILKPGAISQAFLLPLPISPHLTPVSLWSFVFLRSHLLSSGVGEQPSSELEPLPPPSLSKESQLTRPRNTPSRYSAPPLTPANPPVSYRSGRRACMQEKAET